eukprot:10105879-Lingulodinium_polyedra.AAC.1
MTNGRSRRFYQTLGRAFGRNRAMGGDHGVHLWPPRFHLRVEETVSRCSRFATVFAGRRVGFGTELWPSVR